MVSWEIGWRCSGGSRPCSSGSSAVWCSVDVLDRGVILRSGDRQVLTEVIDNALVEPGRQLEVTDALAKMLGIDGTVELEWRFATASGS